MAQDNIEWQKTAISDIAVSRQGIHHEESEGVIEKNDMPIVATNARPSLLR